MSLKRQVIIPPKDAPVIWAWALGIFTVVCLAGAAYFDYVDRMASAGAARSRLEMPIDRSERDADAIRHLTPELDRLMGHSRADGIRVVGAGTWQDPLRIVHDM